MSCALSSLSVHPTLGALNWLPADRMDDTPTDHELMIAVRDGDLDCLGTLFERQSRPLLGFLMKTTGNRAAAEDILQTVFQRMLKYRHTYRDDGSLSAWMYHLARRCTADHFRKASSAAEATDPTVLESHTDSAPSSSEVARASDDQALLHVALSRLDHDDREVLLMSRLKELPFSEIATILECSVGAAKVRAHRALRQLRTIYLTLQKEPLP